MSIDTCKSCGDYVDTDFDADCYDNPVEECQCVKCREDNAPIGGWEQIESAPQGMDVRLSGYIVPSTEAQRNGSKPHWTFGVGRNLGFTWSGILGGNPSHWRAS